LGIISHLRKGRLKIIDCYSSLAGQGEGAIKDPSELDRAEYSGHSLHREAKGSPVTVVLDSLNPIFNGVDEKQAINSHSDYWCEGEEDWRLFHRDCFKGAIPDDAAASSRLWLMEYRTRHRQVERESHRFLSVPKMERRRISSDTVLSRSTGNRGFGVRGLAFQTMEKQLIRLSGAPSPYFGMLDPREIQLVSASRGLPPLPGCVIDSKPIWTQASKGRPTTLL